MLRLVLSLIARLPFGALYALADVTFALIYYAARYRRRLVTDNIARAFPDFTPGQTRATARQFYRNLADYFFETVKLGHITDAEMRRRMVFDNPELIDSLLSQGRSVAVYFSHCFNWEWAPSVTLWSAFANSGKAEFCQVYRPLKNRGFDRWFLHLRSRFGSVSLPKHTVARDLLRLRREGKLTVTGFMSDQRVSHLDHTLDVTLLGRPTEAIMGTEQLAARLDLAAVYWDITRTGRGHYRITTRMIDEHPSRLAPGELTRRYMAMLEETIRRQPANWLWSHNRWKRVNHPDRK